MTDWLGHKTTFGYDADSNLTTVPAGSSPTVTDTSTYDADGAMTSISDVVATSTPKVLGGFSYARNADELVTSATPTSKPAQAYSYDTVNQLSTDAQGSYTYTPAGASLR